MLLNNDIYSFNSMKRKQEIYHYLLIGHKKRVRHLLEAVLADNPHDAEAIYLLAYCDFEQGNYVGALEKCCLALSNSYPAERCHFLMAKINVEIKHFPQAEAHYRETLRINPENAPALAAYGYLLLKTGQEKKAINLLEEALSMDSTDESVLQYYLYYCLYHKPRFDQYAILQRLYQISGSKIRILLNTGLVNYFSGDYKGAREAFKDAFLLDPTNKRLLGLLQNIEKDAHPLFLPLQMATKIGGSIVILGVFILTVSILQLFGMTNLTVIITLLYLVYVTYVWSAPQIYNFLKRW